MISVSRYPENILDVDIDISRNIAGYFDNSRYDTKHYYKKQTIRTHTWGYASIPPSWLYTTYTAIVPVALRFLNPQHAEPAESTESLSEQSNHMGRINLEPSQATASKHWSPRSVPIRVRVRVRVEWSI